MALRGLAAGVSQGNGIVCGAECSDAVFINDYAVATHLYRIAQEAVLNAIKHSRPTQIVIRLTQEGDGVHLSVTDNGITSDEDSDRSQIGIGLSIIKFRTRMAGGRLLVQRNPAGGTTISCTFQQKASRECAPERELQLLAAKG